VGTSSYGPGGTGIVGRINGVGAIPDVFEGSRLSLKYGVTEDNINAANYSLESVKWLVPTFSVVKGYGTFMTLPVGPSPGAVQEPISFFAGGPTVHLAQDPSLFPLTTADLSATTLDCYWGPGAQGRETIMMTATFVKVVNGNVVDRVSADVFDAFNVIRPTGSGAVDTMGYPNVTAGGIDPDTSLPIPQNLQLGDKPRVLGITYHTSVKTDGGITGSFGNIQTMYSNQYYIGINANNVVEYWKNGIFRDAQGNLMIDPVTGRAIASSANTEVLDSSRALGSGPYNSVFIHGREDASVGLNASPPITNSLVGTTIYVNDSPRTVDIRNLNVTPQKYTRIDHFFVYVMYNPNPHPDILPLSGPPDSIWIPVGMMTWRWGMKLEYQNNAWVQIDNGIRGSQDYEENHQYFPTWTRTIQDVSNTWAKVTPFGWN